MTPRGLLQPFIQKLQEQVEALEEKMATVDSTPEDHGDLTAAIMTSFELRNRLRMQEKGTIGPHWEPSFLHYLRKPGFHPRNRKDLEWQMQESVYADELERIWKEAKILPHNEEGGEPNEQEQGQARGTDLKEITDITEAPR